jgi:hypothetical protein
VAGAALASRLDLVNPATGQRPGPVTVATTGSPAGTTTGQSRTPLLCEFLGDLDMGATLGTPRSDLGFEDAADASGDWLPEPAALPQALGEHQFQSGCTRTWARPDGPVAAALFQFPGRPDALAMRDQLRDALRARGVVPGRVPRVTGGELYPLEAGGGNGQLVMFVCNDRVLQLHVTTTDPTPDPLLVQLAQGANRRLHERTGCPL